MEPSITESFEWNALFISRRGFFAVEGKTRNATPKPKTASTWPGGDPGWRPTAALQPPNAWRKLRRCDVLHCPVWQHFLRESFERLVQICAETAACSRTNAAPEVPTDTGNPRNNPAMMCTCSYNDGDWSYFELWWWGWQGWKNDEEA